MAIHRWSSCTRYCILFPLPISYKLFPFSCSSSLFFFFFDLDNNFSSFCMLLSAIHWPWYFLSFLSLHDKVAQFHCSVALLLPLKNFKMKLVSVQDCFLGFVALWSWTVCMLTPIWLVSTLSCPGLNSTTFQTSALFITFANCNFHAQVIFMMWFDWLVVNLPAPLLLWYYLF